MEDRFLSRFIQLIQQHSRARYEDVGGNFSGNRVLNVAYHDWTQWFTSALGLLSLVFGEDSPHYRNLQQVYDRASVPTKNRFDAGLGVVTAAKSDYEGGYYVSLTQTIAGEVFGDFVGLAKKALEEENKDVAAVLACAALEDALKRYATLNDLDVDEQSMKQVVDALKSKGLVSGAQKSLLDTMPKIRDYAMHANWDKISREDVGSVIGFVENFLLSRFS